MTFRNPTSQFVTLDTELPIQFIEIISEDGKIQKSLSIQKESDLQAIDVSTLHSGIYYLTLYHADQILDVVTLSKI
ncbi:MAG: T9SS type A sorting domain-containing protein [Bacteroidota bacterium]